MQSWLLIVASFCFGLLIAITNAAWSPRIIKNEKDKLDNLMKGLINDASHFEIVTEKAKLPGDKGRIPQTDIYEALDKDGKGTGFVFIGSGPGFSDRIKLVIAVDNTCEKLFGFDVLSSNETPGFGSRINEESFRNQFAGAPAAKLELVKTGKPEDIDNQIVAISGATVSSEATVKIFNAYIEGIKEHLRVKGLIDNGS